MNLKILHINYDDQKGGAAIAVNRIHESLKQKGVDSKILVAKKSELNEDFIGPKSTIKEIKYKIFEALNRKIFKLEKKNYDSNSYNLFNNNIIKEINELNFDIVNLHWIGNNFIKINDLQKIKKPIVWTLHDMWPYCGSEHYTTSKRFIEGYNKNNKSHSGLDVERYCWKKKMNYYPKKMSVIATSEWQFNNAKKSLLLSKYQINKIGLPLDFSFWQPINKTIAREILNISQNESVILMGCDNVDRKRKGYKELMAKIIDENDIENLTILTFGENKIQTSLKIRNFKNLKPNSYDLRLLYSCADVYLSPSVQEAFGQTALESISCSTPVVCFGNTGVTDLIKHKETGYVAKQNNFDDFYYGIKWVIKNLKNKLDTNNLNDIKKKFSYERISTEYMDIYKKILEKI
jgi:glycosyltransferase involved in cell wall biosynthesis